MAHRAYTPISQRLLTSLHNILDHTNLTISDIAGMMGADKAKLRRLAYGRVQQLHFSGFVERLELTLADIGDWINNNGHNGITHYVRNNAKKYSMQAVSVSKKAPKRKVRSRFNTGAHFTGRRIVQKKQEFKQAINQHLAGLQKSSASMDQVIKDSEERLKKAARFNTFMNVFLIIDLILLTAFLIMMIVQEIVS